MRDKTGYFQLAGHLRKWYADHDPTSNEVTAGPEYGTVEVLDFYINISTWDMWFCIDDTPNAQKWRKIVTESYPLLN